MKNYLCIKQNNKNILKRKVPACVEGAPWIMRSNQKLFPEAQSVFLMSLSSEHSITKSSQYAESFKSRLTEHNQLWKLLVFIICAEEAPVAFYCTVSVFTRCFQFVEEEEGVHPQSPSSGSIKVNI